MLSLASCSCTVSVSLSNKCRRLTTSSSFLFRSDTRCSSWRRSFIFLWYPPEASWLRFNCSLSDRTSSACLKRICGSSPSWLWSFVNSRSCLTCRRFRSWFSFRNSSSSLLVSASSFWRALMACILDESSLSLGDWPDGDFPCPYNL